MKRGAIAALLLFMISSWIMPQAVMAYSYGDPNKEDIAEAFHVIKEKLELSLPDWDGAFQQYLVHKKVLNLEFGENVTTILEINFSNKNKELLLANYQGMLVMNLKRRFDNANVYIDDYAQSKLLLAKAKGTFDVLAPYVKDGNLTSSIEASFKKALEALGNPGLFGVGKKEASPAQFKSETDFIYSSVKPLFSFQYTVSTESPRATDQPRQPTSTPARPSSSTAPNNTSSPQNPNAQPTPSQILGAATPIETLGIDQTAVVTPSPESTISSGESPANSPNSQGIMQSTMTETKAEDKVNPLITVMVMGLVLIVGGAGVYLGYKKGLFK